MGGGRGGKGGRRGGRGSNDPSLPVRKEGDNSTTTTSSMTELPASIATVNKDLWTQVQVWLEALQKHDIIGDMKDANAMTMNEGARLVVALVVR
jgi:hypothetical protein